jgi:hypothetical protein
MACKAGSLQEGSWNLAVFVTFLVKLKKGFIGFGARKLTVLTIIGWSLSALVFQH